MSPYEVALARQTVFNQVAWTRLQELEATGSTRLTLDFFDDAQSQADARALKATLFEETDDDLSVEPTEGSDWTLIGQTQPTAVSLESVNQWVDWMIIAGLNHQRTIDGWATETP